MTAYQYIVHNFIFSGRSVSSPNLPLKVLSSNNLDIMIQDLDQILLLWTIHILS